MVQLPGTARGVYQKVHGKAAGLSTNSEKMLKTLPARSIEGGGGRRPVPNPVGSEAQSDRLNGQRGEGDDVVKDRGKFPYQLFSSHSSRRSRASRLPETIITSLGWKQ